MKKAPLDEFHLYMYRLVVLCAIYLRLFLLLGLNFADDEDKKATFKGMLWVGGSFWFCLSRVHVSVGQLSHECDTFHAPSQFAVTESPNPEKATIDLSQVEKKIPRPMRDNKCLWKILNKSPILLNMCSKVVEILAIQILIFTSDMDPSRLQCECENIMGI